MDKSNVTQLHPKDKNQKDEASLVSSLSPREIVSELDRFVVGQNKAKRAVAVALRNRWRRQALKGEMKNEVLPKNISTQIFKAMLENSASEQGSRMSAMDNATRNAGEMVDKLTIEYNRSRQAAITKELIEIISGAESL